MPVILVDLPDDHTLWVRQSQSEALNALIAYEPLLPALEAEFKRYI